MLKIPKPQFDSCDETSLKLKWEAISIQGIRSLTLQYKEIHENWADARNICVSDSNQQVVTLTEADVVDLKPGTPYYVRLAIENSSKEIEFGPETVFDTKPIDCTPKRKKCSIS